MTPVLHTFDATPVAPAFTAPAVKHGLLFFPIARYDGKLCYITGFTRVRSRHNRGGSYNVAVVHNLDGSIGRATAARWAKGAKSVTAAECAL